MDMYDLPTAFATHPPHRLVAARVHWLALHRCRDPVLAGYHGHVARNPHPHVGEFGLGALEGFDLLFEVVVPYVIAADVPD